MAEIVEHDQMNHKIITVKKWEWFSTAYNCKISIKAVEGINGKIVVKFLNAKNV